MNSLLFLHGVGGSDAVWERQLSYFKARGRRAVAWNQPGYGGTPLVEPYDFQHVVAALRHQIESLDAEPVVLIGHSMGGLVAQEAYVSFPQLIRALVLCFTSASFGGSGGEFAKQFVAARIDPLDSGQTMAQIAARLMPTMRGAKSAAEGIGQAERIMATVPPDTYRKAVQLLTTFDRRAQLAEIRVPTLLVAGSDDRTAPASVMARMAARIPGAEFVSLAGCGHLGPMDQPDEFNATLDAFLARHAL